MVSSVDLYRISGNWASGSANVDRPGLTLVSLEQFDGGGYRPSMDPGPKTDSYTSHSRLPLNFLLTLIILG